MGCTTCDLGKLAEAVRSASDETNDDFSAKKKAEAEAAFAEAALASKESDCSECKGKGQVQKKVYVMGSSGLGAWWILIIAGSLVLVAAITWLVCCCCGKRKKAKTTKAAKGGIGSLLF